MLRNMQKIDSVFNRQSGVVSGMLAVTEPVRHLRTHARLHLGGRPSDSPARGKQNPGFFDMCRNAGTRCSQAIRGGLPRRSSGAYPASTAANTTGDTPAAIWATLVIARTVTG